MIEEQIVNIVISDTDANAVAETKHLLRGGKLEWKHRRNLQIGEPEAIVTKAPREDPMGALTDDDPVKTPANNDSTTPAPATPAPVSESAETETQMETK